MWNSREIATGTIHDVDSSDERLFWLVSDPEAGSVEDELGREIPRQRLRTCTPDGDVQTLEGSFPPGHSLAAGDDAAFVWDPRGGAVYRAPLDGEPYEVTRIEGHTQGEIRVVGPWLVYVGKIHAGSLGVARWPVDESSDEWDVLLDTEDPTLTAHAMLHVDERGAWYAHHGPRGWTLTLSRGPEESTDFELDVGGVMPRELSGGPGTLYLSTPDAVLFVDFEGRVRDRVETDVPAERLTSSSDEAVWIASAIRDEVGMLTEPWRVRVASRDGTVLTAIESEEPIRHVTGAPWGVACLSRGQTPEFPARGEAGGRARLMLARRGD